MKTKSIEDIISSLMVFYANYREACLECVNLNDQYGSEEYEKAVEERERYARWIRQDIDALKEMGIKFEQFDYIGI